MRRHKHGGIYFTRLRGNGGTVILQSDRDRCDFEYRLCAALEKCGAKVHAFCWLPSELLLMIQVADIPLGRIIQRVTGPYAKAALARRGGGGHLFVHPHGAYLLEDEQLLLDLIQYIHRAPVRAQLCRDTAEYPYSSHRAYLGEAHVPWLSKSEVQRRCATRTTNAVLGYRSLMNKPEATDFLLRLKRGAASSSDHPGRARSARPLDQWLRAVGYRLRTDPALIRSQSRRRDLSLARALVAWRAIQDGTSLAEVARYLARDPSTLISGMNRHRASHENLFAEELKDPLEPGSQRLLRHHSGVARVG